MPRTPDLSALRRLRDARLPIGGAAAARGSRTRAGGPRGDRASLLDGRRFELVVAAILRNEASYIEEWLCHHLAVGVEHFLLYDNGSDDELHKVIRPYVSHGLVTLTWFPLRGGQRDANNHAVRFFGDTADWMAWVDLDEFLVPHGVSSVPAILSRFPDAEQVLVARREFCFCGHRERPAGLVTERYRLASLDVPRVGGSHVLAKPVVRPRGVQRMGIHSATTVSGATVDVTGRRVPEARPLADPVYAPLQVNHYYTKSWAEFEAKRARSSTSTHAFPLPVVPFDIPASVDDAADRWVPRTKAWMERMRALAPDPYRYGSFLLLPDFPRNDPFTVQARAVVANELAGLELPQKQAAIDLPRRSALRGALARAPDGYVPAPGRFSRSVHVRQHLAWLVASTDWSLVEAVMEEPPRLGGDGPWVVEPSAAGGPALLELRAADPGPRCHALLVALRTDAPARVALETRDAPDPGSAEPIREAPWVVASALSLESAGTWLAYVALDAEPRAVATVRVRLERGAAALPGVEGGRAPSDGKREPDADLPPAGASLSPPTRLELYDLALVTFG